MYTNWCCIVIYAFWLMKVLGDHKEMMTVSSYAKVTSNGGREPQKNEGRSGITGQTLWTQRSDAHVSKARSPIHKIYSQPVYQPAFQQDKLPGIGNNGSGSPQSYFGYNSTKKKDLTNVPPPEPQKDPPFKNSTHGLVVEVSQEAEEDESRSYAPGHPIWVQRPDLQLSKPQTSVYKVYPQPVYKRIDKTASSYDQLPGKGEVVLEDRFTLSRPYFTYDPNKNKPDLGYLPPDSSSAVQEAPPSIPVPSNDALPPLAPPPDKNPPTLYDSPYDSYNPPKYSSNYFRKPDSQKDEGLLYPPYGPEMIKTEEKKPSPPPAPLDLPYLEYKPPETKEPPEMKPPEEPKQPPRFPAYLYHSSAPSGPDDDKLPPGVPPYLEYNPYEHHHHEDSKGPPAIQTVPPPDDHDHYHHDSHPYFYPFPIYQPPIATTTTSTTPEPEKERVNKRPYTYYYLGRKLWYIPLYFSVYFIVYIFVLVLKSIARHKIQFNQYFEEGDGRKFSGGEEMELVTETVLRGIENAKNKYDEE